MKCNIIGGSGFIGTRFVRRLQSSGMSSFRIIDKAKGNSYPKHTALADVRSLEQLRTTV